MRPRTGPSLLFMLLFTLLLTGCFDVTEEIWISPDGSGRLTIEMGIEKGLSGAEGSEGRRDAAEALGDGFKEVARRIRTDPRIGTPMIAEWEDDTYLRASIEMKVEDWHDLPAVAQRILGESDTSVEMDDLLLFSLDENEDGMVFYSQPVMTAEPREEPDRGEGSPWVRRLGKAIFDDGTLTVVLHSPTISRTNGEWQSDRLSVRWQRDLADLISRPLEAGSFTAEIGPSARSWHFWRIVSVILAVSFLVALLAWFRRRRRQSEGAPANVA